MGVQGFALAERLRIVQDSAVGRETGPKLSSTESVPTAHTQDPAAGEPALTELVPTPFEDCYRAHFAEMVRLAFLLTGSLETAQDVVQDSFVRLHRRWPRVDEPRAYLRRIVVNGCHSHHRRLRLERRHRPASEDLVTQLGADELSDVLGALPARQRAALVLRFYLDLSDRDAAAVLGCRVGTVASLVHRGLAQLRQEIEP